MTAEKQSVDAISAQLVELRRDLGRVAVEHGLDSKELKDVQARIATLTAKLKEANKIIATEAASNWLYLYPQIVVSKKSVTGYPLNGLNSQFFAYGIKKAD